MRTAILILLLGLCITIISCNNNGEESTYDIVDVEGLIMEIKEDSIFNTGLSIVIKNETEKEYLFEEFYCIEKKIDDKWYEVPRVVKNAAFHDLSINIEEEIEISWEWIYGKLKPGYYRIIKSYIDWRATGDYDKYYISTDFIIGE